MNNKQSICQTDTNTIGVRVSVCGTVILYPTQKRLIYTFSFGLGTVFTQVGRFGRNFLRICINLTNVFAAKNIRFSQFARTKKHRTHSDRGRRIFTRFTRMRGADYAMEKW